jgi:hypothetical protein
MMVESIKSRIKSNQCDTVLSQIPDGICTNGRVCPFSSSSRLLLLGGCAHHAIVDVP